MEVGAGSGTQETINNEGLESWVNADRTVCASDNRNEAVHDTGKIQEYLSGIDKEDID